MMPSFLTPLRRLTQPAILVMAAIALSIGLLPPSLPVSAATDTVTNNSDNNPGSLRAVIAAAASGDTITFASSLNGQTITLTSGEIAITQNLTIVGPGANNLTISGNNNSTIFHISGTQTSPVTVSISGLTLTDGNAPSTSNFGGGAILVEDTAGNSSITESTPVLNLNNMAIVNNNGSNAVNGGGGGLSSRKATINLTNSTVSGNTAQQGGGIEATGRYVTITIVQSTIAGNNATGDSNGIGGGGGVDFTPGFVNNATVGALNIVQSTIDGNHASGSQSTGGNLDFGGETNTVTFKNSLIADGTSATTGPDIASTCNGLPIDDGHNLIGNLSGANFGTTGTPPCSTNPFGGTNVVNMASNVGAFGMNGGVLETVPLQISSAAVDLVPLASCTDLSGAAFTTDERGDPRPSPPGGNCDSGAYELQQATPTPTNTATVTASLTSTHTATPTNTASLTASVTPSLTASLTATATNTASLTASVTPSDTLTATLTPSLTASVTATATNTASLTASVTPSSTLTATNTPSLTASVTATATNTASLTASVTPSNTLTATVTPSNTATLTATNTPTLTASNTATITPSATLTASLTNTLTQTATSTNTATPPPHLDTVGVLRGTTFYLQEHNTTSGSLIVAPFISGLPVAGDWTGAGVDRIGAVNTLGSTLKWTICTATDNTTCGTTANQQTLLYGNLNDVPFGWHVGNGSADGVAVYRASNGLMLYHNAPTTGYSDDSMVYGSPGDQPVAGDWTGAGHDSPGVYRPASAQFFLSNQVIASGVISTSYSFSYGNTGTSYIPLAGQWLASLNHDGVGLFTSTTDIFYLKNDPTTGGAADNTFLFGNPGDSPVAGHWLSVYPPASILIAATAAPQPQNGTSGSVSGGNQIGG